MTLPLGHLSDHILIEELKLRGYRVPKKEYVRVSHVQQPFDDHEWRSIRQNPAWLDSTKRMLGKKMGSHLTAHGAYDFIVHEPQSDGIWAGLWRLEVRATTVVSDPKLIVPETPCN